MNIYFRLIYVFIKSIFAAKKNILQESCLRFHVLPSDCDLNFHMTNSRYFSFMDLGRLYYLGQIKWFSYIIKERCMAVLIANEISFLKPLNPFAPFDLKTRLIFWDEKYFYFEQRFESDKGVHAIALVKGLFLAKNRKVSVISILEKAGEFYEVPAEPEMLKRWRELTEAKKSL